MNIEEKLSEYRRRKEKEKEAELLASKPLWERVLPGKLSTVIKSYNNNNQTADVPHNPPENDDSNSSSDTAFQSPKEADEISSLRERKSARSKPRLQKSVPPTPKDADVEPESSAGWDTFQLILLGLKILLWLILFLLFVELEWGAVFVVFSAFALIFANFRQGRRKPWEPSAYSVFNPGCEAIDGTIKPEQFEREIRYGF